MPKQPLQQEPDYLEGGKTSSKMYFNSQTCNNTTVIAEWYLKDYISVAIFSKN